MKVALVAGVPEPLIGFLRGHDVQSVRQLGLEGVKNGKLPASIAAGQFDAFITNDKRMEAEGQLMRRPFAILILSATNWPVIKRHAGKIAEALETTKSGEVARIDVGRFLPRLVRGQQP